MEVLSLGGVGGRHTVIVASTPPATPPENNDSAGEIFRFAFWFNAGAFELLSFPMSDSGVFRAWALDASVASDVIFVTTLI